MVEKRKGMKLIHSFPEGKRVVGIIQYKEKIVIATEDGLYEYDGKKVVKMEVKEALNAK
jgi:hypothetical protein